MNAIRELFGRLIDHAALFPPASMAMPEAMAVDRAARASEHAWMLDRFICPASISFFCVCESSGGVFRFHV